MEIHITWSRGFQTDLPLDTACCSSPCWWQGWQLELLALTVARAPDSNGGCQHWLCTRPMSHPTSCSSAAHQPSPSTGITTISFLIFPQPCCISSSSSYPPFTDDQHWQELALVAEAVWQLANRYQPHSWAPFFATQRSVSTSSITQAAESSCQENYGLKQPTTSEKKKKRCLKCQYICKILGSVETFKWILNAQLSMACSLQGIILCWMSSPFSSWPSLNFCFLTKSLCILHLSKMDRNTGLCHSLNLHVIPLQSLKIFFLWYLFILLCCISN